jgi:hypothetical protein
MALEEPQVSASQPIAEAAEDDERQMFSQPAVTNKSRRPRGRPRKTRVGGSGPSNRG